MSSNQRAWIDFKRADPATLMAATMLTANVTRLPSSGADPALILLAKAQEVVSADIAYRLQLEDRCERQAEFIERLETRIAEMEGVTP